MPKKSALPLITNFDHIPNEALVPPAEQPYPIPNTWKWVTFSSLNSYKNHSVDPKKYGSEIFELYSVPAFPSGSPEILNASNIGSSKLLVEPEDVLVCKINPRINRVWTVGKRGKFCQIASSEWIVFRSILGAADYFRWYFQSEAFRHLLTSNVAGVGGSLTRARPKDVAHYPIPLPPLEEQHRIVAELNSKTATIDNVLECLDDLLESKESKRINLIKAAVQGNATRQWRSKPGVAEADWLRTTLGQEFQWSSGVTPSRRNPEYYSGTIPWVKSGELPNGLVEEVEEYITDEAVARSAAKIFPKGSTLIAMYGATIGKVGILSFEATTNQAIAVAIPNKDNYNRYLFYFLQANKDKFIECAKGGAQPNISQRVIKQFPYRKPRLAEQHEIVRILDQELERFDRAHELIQQVRDKLVSVRAQLVSAALAGRL